MTATSLVVPYFMIHDPETGDSWSCSCLCYGLEVRGVQASPRTSRFARGGRAPWQSADESVVAGGTSSIGEARACPLAMLTGLLPPDTHQGGRSE